MCNKTHEKVVFQISKCYSKRRLKIEWKLFDDDKSILCYKNWAAVLNYILQFGNLPTLIIYEKVSLNNVHLIEPKLTPL